MNSFKFFFYAGAIILLISSMLVGCNIIPEEYTKGVKLDRSYPEDDMPIYDDALVYYSKDDDKSVTIKFGTQDDLDDVAEFYKYYFEDSSIVPEDEKDRSTRYTAEGMYKDFKFEIRATAPSEGYEAQLFNTVVRIEIEFIHETVTTSGAQADLAQELFGFWRQESLDDGTSLTELYSMGVAIMLNKDGTAESYDNFLHNESATWEVIDEKTVVFTLESGSKRQITVMLENRDGREYMTWDDTKKVFTFFRDTSEDFLLYDPNAHNQDEQLRAALVDKTWYFVHYCDANSQVYTDAFGYSIYNSDGTFEEEYSGITDYGTWYISDSQLYCTLNDDTISHWPIHITVEDDISYLYFHDNDSSEYWLYSDVVQQTTNTSPIADKTWYIYAYIDNDGTRQVYSTSETMMLSSDSSFEYYHTDESTVSGTWELKDNELYIHYTDGSTLSWTAGHECLFGVNTLYLTDSSGGDWVYTDISLINGPVILPTDERITNALVGSNFYSVHYLYPDGFQEEMTVTTLIYHEDGTFYEDFGGEILNGTWYFKNGILHMEYPSLGEIHDYPDSYLEYDPESNSLTLYMGDDQEGFEGGYWLFSTYEP